jgi:hypothetical protein
MFVSCGIVRSSVIAYPTHTVDDSIRDRPQESVWSRRPRCSSTGSDSIRDNLVDGDRGNPTTTDARATTACGQQPVTLRELRAGGIDFPAVVLSELELNGYAIERVYEHARLIGVRLLETASPVTPVSRRRPRWRRPSR